MKIVLLVLWLVFGVWALGYGAVTILQTVIGWFS